MKDHYIRGVRLIGGASLMITLPKEYMDALGIEAGDYVRIELDEDTGTITITATE